MLLRLRERELEVVVRFELSDEVVRLVFAFCEPESQAVIYTFYVQNLSERSAVDVERLVRCVKKVLSWLKLRRLNLMMMVNS
ncbi:hypothetical protein HanRHA438_Chr09g0410351 [Helianthus annuus]|nr:hypothetical protein HanRHA438_Chr09g0410351 [Helianthus annuus]